jgi:two-component system, cell cycle sensor histidine kinase and response regulator CckA
VHLTSPKHDGAPRQRTVLVVDDEELVRLLVARALSEAGYRVLQACHGAGALGILEGHGSELDLVVCDLVMPLVSGRDVGRWITAHYPRLPILYVSGYPRAYLEAHDLYDPSVTLLRKPFLPSRLLEAVDEALGPHRPSQVRTSPTRNPRES